MKCPICFEETKHEMDRLDGWLTLEEEYICPKKHYFEEYLYGYCRTFVNGKEYFVGSYDEENYNLKFKLMLWLDRLLCRIHINWLRQ